MKNEETGITIDRSGTVFNVRRSDFLIPQFASHYTTGTYDAASSKNFATAFKTPRLIMAAL